MNKLLFLVIGLLSNMYVYSQGPTIGLQVGSGFAGPAQVLGSYTDQLKTANIYGTIGAGFSATITPGYFLKPHFGMELGFSYFVSPTILTHEFKSDYGVAKATIQTVQTRILPSLVFQHKGEKLGYYMKTGLVLKVGGKSIYKEEDTGSGELYPNHQTYAQTNELKHEFGVGYSGTIGGSIKLNSKLDFTAELTGIYLQLQSKSMSMKASSYQGVDNLASLSVSQKEVVYADLKDIYPITGFDEARTELAWKQSFNAVFFQLGLKYHF